MIRLKQFARLWITDTLRAYVNLQAVSVAFFIGVFVGFLLSAAMIVAPGVIGAMP